MEPELLIWMIWNLIVFLLYGIDKWKAIHNRWRISERTLLLLAFCVGSVGALCGMAIFRHKTKKMKFKILVPLALVLHLVLYYLARRNFILG